MLTDNDKQRIEQEAEQRYSNDDFRRYDFKRGAEYATRYERQQQASLQTENSIYFQERNEAWKQNAQLEAERTELQQQVSTLKETLDFDAVCKVDLECKIKELEAERSELRNKVIDKLNVLKNQAITKTKPYSAGCIDTIDIIEDFLNSLKL